MCEVIDLKSVRKSLPQIREAIPAPKFSEHHAGDFMFLIKTILDTKCGADLFTHKSNSLHGEHIMTFRDVVTGQRYVLTIKPLE